MAEFIVNVTLIVALLVLLVVWAISARRRRQRDRREHAQERRLILSAFTAAAGAAPADADVDPDEDLDVPVRPSRTQRPARAGPRLAPAQQLDATSIAALLDLLEDRKPARRGAMAGLFTSPRSVWSAGTRAGQSIGRYSVGESDQDTPAEGAELYREAAGELVDIYAHDPADARTQYAHYAAAVGDLALAELYVRSAVYATYADHNEVAQVVEDITRAAHGPELSDDTATIDT